MSKMRALLGAWVVLGLCAGRAVSADTSVPASGAAKPSIILIEYEPRAMVRDVPTFALYEDGTVIYGGADLEQHIVELTRTQRATLARDIGITELARLKDEYRASYATDQPTNRVCVWTPARKCVAVYGDLRPGSAAFPGDPTNAVPATFRRAFDRMIAFSHTAAKRWSPRQLEIMLQPLNGDIKVEWPQNWGTAQLTKHGATNEVFLDGRFEDELRALFHQHLGQRWTFVIGGRGWTVTGARTPFPNESEWMR